jgi:hypothetical protein
VRSTTGVEQESCGAQLYFDGISEAANSNGQESGRDPLMTATRALSSPAAETFGVQLVRRRP